MLASGYILITLMGFTLGLIGAGGSILAMPILVYLFKIDALLATNYSLFIVGLSALIGAYIYQRKNLINFDSLKVFIPSALVTLLISRLILLPNLPELIFTIKKEIIIMLIFAIIMILAAFSMINRRKIREIDSQESPKWVMFLSSAISGFVAGLVGAGGGFIIVPTLILFFKINAKSAIATSLAIISINSLIGFAADIVGGFSPDWKMLSSFAFLTIIGMIFGSLLAEKLDTSKLKTAFAFFILILGFVILTQEILSILN